jgi:hypothetical protein
MITYHQIDSVLLLALYLKDLIFKFMVGKGGLKDFMRSEQAAFINMTYKFPGACLLFPIVSFPRPVSP